jgi:hypothetical protein
MSEQLRRGEYAREGEKEKEREGDRWAQGTGRGEERPPSFSHQHKSGRSPRRSRGNATEEVEATARGNLIGNLLPFDRGREGSFVDCVNHVVSDLIRSQSLLSLPLNEHRPYPS